MAQLLILAPADLSDEEIINFVSVTDRFKVVFNNKSYVIKLESRKSGELRDADTKEFLSYSYYYACRKIRGKSRRFFIGNFYESEGVYPRLNIRKSPGLLYYLRNLDELEQEFKKIYRRVLAEEIIEDL